MVKGVSIRSSERTIPTTSIHSLITYSSIHHMDAWDHTLHPILICGIQFYSNEKLRRPDCVETSTENSFQRERAHIHFHLICFSFILNLTLTHIQILAYFRFQYDVDDGVLTVFFFLSTRCPMMTFFRSHRRSVVRVTSRSTRMSSFRAIYFCWDVNVKMNEKKIGSRR